MKPGLVDACRAQLLVDGVVASSAPEAAIERRRVVAVVVGVGAVA